MSRIDEIKERHEEYARMPEVYDWVNGEYYTNDISYLLSKLEIAQKALEEILERESSSPEVLFICSIIREAGFQLEDD